MTDNGWNNDTVNTFRSWKQSLAKASFIYQHILEKYTKKLNLFLILSLILSATATIIAGISTTTLTVDSDKYKYISLALNISLLVIGVLNTIFSGLIKILKLTDQTTLMSSYVDKLDAFYFIVSTQLSLPVVNRKNGSEFLTDHTEKYIALLNESPQVLHSDYSIACDMYVTYLQNDDSYSQYFEKKKVDDGTIEIV